MNKFKDQFLSNKAAANFENVKATVEDIAGDVTNPKMLKEAGKIALDQFRKAKDLGNVCFSDGQIQNAFKKLKTNKSLF